MIDFSNLQWTIDPDTINNFFNQFPSLFWITIIALTEIIFIAYISKVKKKKEENLWNYIIINKLYSSIVALAFIAIALLIIFILPAILVTAFFIGVLAIFFLINRVAYAIFGGEESDEEAEKRMDEEDKEIGYKFRVGERVKIKSQTDANEGQMKFRVGEIVTICKRKYSDEMGITYYTSDGTNWGEKRFAKLRRKRR